MFPGALVAFIVACGATPPAPHPQAVSARPVEPVARDQSDPSDDRLTDVELMARLGNSEQVYPLRVTRILSGPMYQDEGGAVSNTPRDSPVLATLQVIEVRADPDSDPRVVCEGRSTRLALYVDRDSLALVALADAVIRAAPSSSEGPDEPGVFLRPGERLETSGAVPAVGVGEAHRRVRYGGLLWSATGYVRSTTIGHIFPHREGSFDRSYDVALPNGTTILDAPSGRPLARFLPFDNNSSQRHLARKLGPRRAGYVLLSIATAGARVVGWAPESDVVPEAPGLTTSGFGSGSGSGRPSLQNPVVLPEGTVIHSHESRRPVGLVTRSGPFDCVDQCESDWRDLSVPTCVGAMRVWVQR